MESDHNLTQKSIKEDVIKFENEIITKANPDFFPAFHQVLNRINQMIDSLENKNSVGQDLIIPNDQSPEAYINAILRLERSQILSNLQIYRCKVPLLNACIYKKGVIIQGDTGCGKSTQIPQYFFTDPRFYSYSVYVTEPRKLAAINL